MKDKTTKAIPYIWIDFIPALVLPNILTAEWYLGL
jgi:hypothetical protein